MLRPPATMPTAANAAAKLMHLQEKKKRKEEKIMSVRHFFSIIIYLCR